MKGCIKSLSVDPKTGDWRWAGMMAYLGYEVRRVDWNPTEKFFIDERGHHRCHADANYSIGGAPYDKEHAWELYEEPPTDLRTPTRVYRRVLTDNVVWIGGTGAKKDTLSVCIERIGCVIVVTFYAWPEVWRGKGKIIQVGSAILFSENAPSVLGNHIHGPGRYPSHDARPGSDALVNPAKAADTFWEIVALMKGSLIKARSELEEVE